MSHLARIRFERLGETAHTVVFERDDVLITFRRIARLPGMLMNNAFYEAGMDPPDLATFCCD